MNDLKQREATCPICLEQMKAVDICASDIELGICHAACLEGSPVVDLETGEPSDGPATTFRYGGDEAEPAAWLVEGEGPDGKTCWIATTNDPTGLYGPAMPIRPLYAHPSPSSVQTGVAVKRLEWKDERQSYTSFEFGPETIYYSVDQVDEKLDAWVGETGVIGSEFGRTEICKRIGRDAAKADVEAYHEKRVLALLSALSSAPASPDPAVDEKRLDHVQRWNEPQYDDIGMQTDPHGEWIRYDDVLASLRNSDAARK